MHTEFWLGNVKERDNLEEIGSDERNNKVALYDVAADGHSWWTVVYAVMELPELPEQTNAQGKAKHAKLSSDNLKRNSNLENLNIDRRVDNEADHSAYIGYITFELGLSFSGRSAVAKLQWNIKFHRTA